jgi:NADPH-dependent curcumin reductase CurA
MQGFIISDHFDRYPEFVREVGGWLQTGKLKHQDTLVEGIENAPKAFLGLFAGENLGKMIVQLGPDPSAGPR